MMPLMPKGYLCLVLHAHLPYVRHPEHGDVLEEDWLFEAITETYLPLLNRFQGWCQDKLAWRLTMSITPTLSAMLEDKMLKERYLRYLDNLIELADKEQGRVQWDSKLRIVVEMYLQRLYQCRETYVKIWDCDLLKGFRYFFEAGHLELITCAATHPFLPLVQNPVAVGVQVELGCREFEKQFGRRPQGIWLPECGYYPGLEEVLSRAGLRYFFVDTHGITNAEPRPRYGVYAPVVLPNLEIVAVGRDSETARQVWSPVEGYPADAWYRDFYHDIGFQLDFDYLKPHLHSLGVRHFTGLKYQRITGRTENKEVYEPDRASERASVHADHFLCSRLKQIQWLTEAMPERPPLVTAPFDAELFGHWWFEGPEWLDKLVRLTALESEEIQLIAVPDYLEKFPIVQICTPAFSSWGEGGYCEVWLNQANDWIYPNLHRIVDRLQDLANQLEIPDRILERAMNQAVREILLAQSSDWAFIMKMGTMFDYAVQRTHTHLENADDLLQQVERQRIDLEKLEILESRNPIFAEVNYRSFRSN
ncbi:DUF1957 domain-containing protein [Telmatocola sphagniphila]|uniref:DUF1957 domain-containing protein n=1 Tax=Telmatocola sphagniphila TaxID=1123043 RepID=A0A8E6B8J8_9BACT|nr:1,4-alpha-glucan branching protein domain-containing protein [Telmatocola sphagniphila]QVL33449.1 DUF1957 domain-containing protein [Telmatocola sphagniphila]